MEKVLNLNIGLQGMADLPDCESMKFWIPRKQFFFTVCMWKEKRKSYGRTNFANTDISNKMANQKLSKDCTQGTLKTYTATVTFKCIMASHRCRRYIQKTGSFTFDSVIGFWHLPGPPHSKCSNMKRQFTIKGTVHQSITIHNQKNYCYCNLTLKSSWNVSDFFIQFNWSVKIKVGY